MATSRAWQSGGREFDDLEEEDESEATSRDASRKERSSARTPPAKNPSSSDYRSKSSVGSPPAVDGGQIWRNTASEPGCGWALLPLKSDWGGLACCRIWVEGPLRLDEWCEQRAAALEWNEQANLLLRERSCITLELIATKLRSRWRWRWWWWWWWWWWRWWWWFGDLSNQV